MKTLKEMTAEIRSELKKNNITSRQVSVTGHYAGYSEAIDVNIKDLTVNIDTVEKIANKHESIRYDQASGEILQGANTYVSVKYDHTARGEAAKRYIPLAERLINKYTKLLSPGSGQTIASKDDKEVIYFPHRDNNSGQQANIAVFAVKEITDRHGSYRDINKIYWDSAYNVYVLAESLAMITAKYGINNYN
jgi:hypothetical protein